MASVASALLLGSPPVPRTRLIGRELERATGRAYLLDEAGPLLTLTGPGGVGKTRLVLALAADVAAAFADGVVWVDLAPLADAAQVPATIAAALGITPAPDKPLISELIRNLRPRQTLLLLDNCEHLLAETFALVAELLTHAPALQLLATSRAPLRLRGEQILRVEPLALPPVAGSSLEAFGQNSSVRLFVERARAVRSAFRLTDANAPQVAEVCRRLDGLPLAIELAAARISMLSPEALAADLNDRLRLIDVGPRDLPARQQTIENTIAWSYALLDSATQSLFRRLSVFLGGFTLEAVQAMRPGDQTNDDVAAGLTALVEQSLVCRLDIEGEPRFTLLETIRAFSLERLEETGGRDSAQDAHAAYIIALAARASRHFASALERKRIAVEQGNIRMALTRLAAVGDADGALRLASALADTSHVYVTPQEGRAWLEWALAHTAEIASVPRGLALAGLAMMLWVQGQYEPARHLAEDSRAIADQLDDIEVAAHAIFMLGNVAVSQHDWDQAKPLMEQAVRLWRDLGNRAAEALSLQVLAGAEHGLGDEDASACHALEALALFREIGHASGGASALSRLGRLARDQGNDRAAALAYHEMLQLCADDGSLFSLVQAFAGLGELASRRGQAEIAAVLLGVIDAIAQEAGATRLPAAGVNYDRATAAAFAALGAERFDVLHATGRKLRLDKAILLAETVMIPAASSREADPPWSLLHTDGLSNRQQNVSELLPDGRRDPLASINELLPAPAIAIDFTYREQEVLALLGQRRTDLEIAARLFISRKTVSNHVSNILAKLGAANRRDAAAIAARLGLL